MSNKSVKQECLTRVLRNSVKQGCPTRVPPQCVKSGCPTIGFAGKGAKYVLSPLLRIPVGIRVRGLHLVFCIYIYISYAWDEKVNQKINRSIFKYIMYKYYQLMSG